MGVQRCSCSQTLFQGDYCCSQTLRSKSSSAATCTAGTWGLCDGSLARVHTCAATQRPFPVICDETVAAALTSLAAALHTCPDAILLTRLFLLNTGPGRKRNCSRLHRCSQPEAGGRQHTDVRSGLRWGILCKPSRIVNRYCHRAGRSACCHDRLPNAAQAQLPAGHWRDLIIEGESVSPVQISQRDTGIEYISDYIPLWVGMAGPGSEQAANVTQVNVLTSAARAASSWWLHLREGWLLWSLRPLKRPG